MNRRRFLQGLAGCLAAGVAPMAFGIGPAGLSVPRRLAERRSLEDWFLDENHHGAFVRARPTQYVVTQVHDNRDVAIASVGAFDEMKVAFPRLRVEGNRHAIKVGDVITFAGGFGP